MISCVAVDDEPLALVVLQEYISRTPALELKHSFTDGFAAMNFLKKQEVDMMFLDIRMPQITGIQLIRSLPKPPLVIFTTAYSNYAVDGFNLDAIDFLLKPFEYERFLKAVNKASEYLNYRDKPGSTQNSDFIFVKSEYQILKINLDAIRFIEGMDDYVKIFVADQTVGQAGIANGQAGLPNGQGGRMILTNMPMKDILRKLPANRFVRVHRSFIVPLNRIESVRNKRIRIEDKLIPVGDSYAESFFKIIGEKG